ncbi:MAG: hypothetical protein DMG61_08415 [Acidobacteria bacterium]|nr:MAG: hypothetical protein DMG61_08415 [Acidobacteriota bacterium]
MDQSTVQTVGTTPNGAGATATAPKPSTNAATAMPSEASTGNSLVASPPQPVTKTLGSGGLVDPSDVADLLAPKPLQPSKLSLIGGTVKSIDQIRDNMTVHVYDSGTMHVKFDQRTHFYRDGKETTQLTVKKGDRVYLDTQLFEGKVFAKNVHVESGSRSADASGQIVSFNRKTGDMVVQDQLAGSAVKFRVDPQTTIKHGDAKTTASALRPGSLIAVKFSPRSRSTGTAEEVSIIAAPGTSFTYFGRVTHIDLRSGLLAIENQADGKVYDVHFDSSTRIPQNLTVGSQVTAVAMFRGNDYVAQSIEVNSGPDRAAKSEAEENAAATADQDQANGKHQKKARSKDDRSKSNSKDRDKDDDQQ